MRIRTYCGYSELAATSSEAVVSEIG